MNKSILIVFIVFFTACTEEKRTYYDANWEETIKENATFYRPTPKKEKGIWQISDYYITGEKQFKGQAKDSLAILLDGDVTWYFKTGKVQNKVRYLNGKVVGEFVVKSGIIGSAEGGWEESDLLYLDPHNKPANAQSASSDIYEYYYTGTYRVAIQHHSNVGDDDKVSFNLYFNKRGDTIGRLDKSKSSEKWNGIEALFYETEQPGKNGMISIKEIKTYSKGDLIQVKYYNTNEEQIAVGGYKNAEPFTGTFLKESCRLKKIQHYKKGVLLKETTFNKNNEKIGEISFKNKVPNTGVFFNCTSLLTYKNGMLDGPTVQYLNDEAAIEDSKFVYKNGVKHGDYYIYDGTLLEKGTYNTGMQRGEVWYYHNGIFYEGDDADSYYYLKAMVQSVNSKPFISEISQYDLDTNELQQTYKFEANTTDTFTYINNGYHAIYLNDINSDGFNDLQITYSHNMHDITTNTYYLFNSETSEYRHIPEFDYAEIAEIITSEKSIKIALSDRYVDQINYVTYSFLKNKLIKKLEIEEVYHQGKDTTVMTQIFPIPVNDFPLLDPNLPPITFVQKGNEQPVTNTDHTVRIKKEPFSITLPGLPYKEGSQVFVAKVIASYDITLFNVAEINQKEEDTPFYGEYASIAHDPNDPELYLSNDSYNVLYHDNTIDDSLGYIKNINEDVLLLQFTIDSIYDEGKSVPISEIKNPIYMVVYSDKNENEKIEANELFYITINWK